MVIDYLVARRGKLIEESGISIISIPSDESKSNEKLLKSYLTKITGICTTYGLKRIFMGTYVNAKMLNEKDIIELQSIEHATLKRIYYQVRDGVFCPFAIRTQKLIRGRKSVIIGEDANIASRLRTCKSCGLEFYSGTTCPDCKGIDIKLSVDSVYETIQSGTSDEEYDVENPPFEENIPSEFSEIDKEDYEQDTRDY